MVRYRGKPHTIGRADLIPLRVAREEARKLLLGLLRGQQVAFSRRTMEELAAAPRAAAQGAQERQGGREAACGH